MRRSAYIFLLATLVVGVLPAACADDPTFGKPATSAPEDELLGAPCQADADCPRGSVCVDAKALTGSVMSCVLSSDGSQECTATTLVGPDLGWSLGYCSPLCTSDEECAASGLHGACRLRVSGDSLEVWTGPPSGGGVCSMACVDAESCPVGFDCRVGGRCNDELDTGERTCVPCSIDPTEPDGGTVAPGSWTCPVSFYGDGACDCGCGSLDPDCTGPTIEACDECPLEDGACGDCTLIEPMNNAVCVSGPTGWGCLRELFGDGLCDCGCGARDEDCASPGVDACGRCPGSDQGGCNGAGPACPGLIDPADNTKCIGTEGWTCSVFYYGDGTCDCGCGIVDTDCSAATSEVCESCPLSGCSLLEFECPGSIDSSDNSRCVEGPVGWTCAPAWFGDGACDCGCGVLDSDCASSLVESCAQCRGILAGGCNDDAGDACPGSIDPLDNATCRSAPPEWTCAAEYFDQGDGVCDCGCGAVDPDCANSLVGSCDVCHDAADGGCNTDGLDCPGSIAPANNAGCVG